MQKQLLVQNLILSRNDTSIAVDDLIGGIQFKANDASSSPDPQICGIKAISTGATNTNPKLNFFAGESNYSANTPNMVIDSSGHVGIGTSSPGTYNLNIQDSSASATALLRGGSGQGVYQEFDVNGGTTIGYIGDAANLVSGGSQTDLAIRATNNIEFSIGLTEKAKVSSSGLNVNGALSKSSGSFKIDHPLENKKDTHHLVHSFVEAPQADNIYRGKVNLVSGTATVNIDTVAGMSEGTFVLLNREIQCFTSNETGWTAVKGSVSGNTLTITAQDNTCDDTISWMVIGERQDQHMYDTEWTDENGKVIVEPLKETETTTP
jgi:phosphoribosyl-AMP cyclohydrolase